MWLYLSISCFKSAFQVQRFKLAFLQFSCIRAVAALHFGAAVMRRPAASLTPPYQLQLAPLGKFRRNTSCSCAQDCSTQGPALSAAVYNTVTTVYCRATGFSILQSTYCIFPTSDYTRLISHSKPYTAHFTLDS